MGRDYRETLQEQTPTVLQGRVGRRYNAALGLMLDATVQACREALTRPWLRRGLPIADDTLAALGHQRNLERYPVESKPQYRARVDRAWLDWVGSGGPQALIDQFAAAGYPGVRVMYQWSPDLPVTPAVDWRTQFWVFFPYGSHPATGVSPKWGEFKFGDGTVWGPVGITRPEIELMRRIIRKWKDGLWICRNMIFALQPEAQVVAQSSFAYAIGTGTMTPVIPNVVQADDILVAHIEWVGGGSDVTIPTGQGWTGSTGGGTEHRTLIVWKRWGSGDTDTLTPEFACPAGSQHAMKIVVVRHAVATGTPITGGFSSDVAAASELASGNGLMTAGNVSIANPRSLALRFFASRENNEHGVHSEGQLIYGGHLNQAQMSLSCSALEGASTGITSTATMQQQANAPSDYRASTVVIQSANTSVAYATLAP